MPAAIAPIPRQELETKFHLPLSAVAKHYGEPDIHKKASPQKA
jgi:hypothetical protein